MRYGMFVWHEMHFWVRVQPTPTPSRYSAAFAAENCLAIGSSELVGVGLGEVRGKGGHRREDQEDSRESHGDLMIFGEPDLIFFGF